MKLQIILLTVVAVIGLSACQSKPTMPESALACESPRPQMCTRDYRPACGYISESEQKTYSNPCVACSDATVKWVEQGQCK
ncbi:hypothetical protein [Neptuniibacter sp.]|uniref:hypothetical protein n=1 Tax=Neptuniibacter sp. TaxID=1962643 RepID=UPI002604F6C3|nr:hypothetical protein [Neptuniibacter sp.]MCP4598163.1 hypothetical protein [Neptuniibacter sp.]